MGSCKIYTHGTSLVQPYQIRNQKISLLIEKIFIHCTYSLPILVIFRFQFFILTGTFGKSKNYAVSATMRMVDMGKFSTNYGYMGIAFNMMDSKNYDIAYVRLI